MSWVRMVLLLVAEGPGREAAEAVRATPLLYRPAGGKGAWPAAPARSPAGVAEPAEREGGPPRKRGDGNAAQSAWLRPVSSVAHLRQSDRKGKTCTRRPP